MPLQVISYDTTTLPPAIGYATPSKLPAQTSATDSDMQFNNVTTPINVTAGVEDRNTAGGLLPLAVLSGNSYIDTNDNNILDGGDLPVVNSAITLVGTDDVGRQILRTTLTDAKGLYFFDGLRPGTYQLSESQPVTLADGIASPGTAGGISSPNFIAQIAIDPCLIASGYNFGNSRFASLSGTAYVDDNNNNIRDLNELGLANIRIELSGLTNAGLVIQRTTTTDANGYYLFDQLPAGTYTLSEVQPANFLDGQDRIGTLGGAGTDDRFQVRVGSGQSGIDYQFGERRATLPSKREFLASADPI